MDDEIRKVLQQIEKENIKQDEKKFDYQENECSRKRFPFEMFCVIIEIIIAILCGSGFIKYSGTWADLSEFFAKAFVLAIGSGLIGILMGFKLWIDNYKKAGLLVKIIFFLIGSIGVGAIVFLMNMIIYLMIVAIK